MLYVLVWCAGLMCLHVLTGVLYVLDWRVVCTGLVCCMYRIVVLYVLIWCAGLMCLHVLDWCAVCTGLIRFMYLTGVLHVLDWSVAKGHQDRNGGYEPGKDHVTVVEAVE